MNDKELTVEECPVKGALFRIKPLEWEWFEMPDIRGWFVDLCGFSAMIYQQIDYGASHHMASPVWTGWTIDATSHQTADCASPEEGKQLAEQHWQAYIKQALIEASQQ